MRPAKVFMLGRSVNNLIERNVAQMQSFDTKLVSDKYAGEISFKNVMLKLEHALVHVLSERVLCLGKGAMANADTKFLKPFFILQIKSCEIPPTGNVCQCWRERQALSRLNFTSFREQIAHTSKEVQRWLDGEDSAQIHVEYAPDHRGCKENAEFFSKFRLGHFTYVRSG